MKTINYQGQGISAVEVSEFDGDIPMRPNEWAQGTERLYRSGTGRYYLYRQLDLLDVHTPRQRRASGVPHIHRLSLTAAALWAASRLTTVQTSFLRHALQAALKANRRPAKETSPQLGLSDLNHVAESHLREYVQSRKVDPRDALSGAVIQAFSEESFITSDAIDYSRDVRREQEGNQATPDPEEAVHLLLEPKAGKMLQRYCELSDEHRTDVINSAVINWLEAKLDNEDELAHVYDVDVRRARRRRLGRARKYRHNLAEGAGGRTVRFTALDGRDPWKVDLTKDTTAALEEVARGTRRTFADALLATIKEGLSRKTQPATCIVRALPAAGRPDLALCAAATVSSDDDEDQETAHGQKGGK